LGWSNLQGVINAVAMSPVTFTTNLTIGELEASFSLYRKALRILILEDKSIDQIRRSVCWQRLTSLHQALPHQYKDPSHLYFLLKRESNK
jgi:hypothetical protein